MIRRFGQVDHEERFIFGHCGLDRSIETAAGRGKHGKGENGRHRGRWCRIPTSLVTARERLAREA